MNIEDIRFLYDYNRWANRRTFDAASALSREQFAKDLGSSHSSVKDTLIHILVGEWGWLRLWKGIPPGGLPDSWDLGSVDSIRRQLVEVEQDQVSFIEGLTEDALHAMVSWTNARGETHYPLDHLMQHLANHSTYHRGQVIGMLRQLGAEAVATDFLIFLGLNRGLGEEKKEEAATADL